MNQNAENKPAPDPNRQQLTTDRLLGVHPQKQPGLFMQRIKVFGGRITWQQWRRIAQLTTLYSPDTPFHVTTRQDVELHNIAGANIPAIQQALTEVGLTTFAAGGDSIRNMTVCPGCDLSADGFDLMPIARLVCQYLEHHPGISNLPRKFKISFSGCQRACARPWLSDLGFIAQSNKLFSVIGAGSLGPKPAPGIQLYKDLAAKDILPLCVAATELFKQQGDRQNRSRARFRHIRETLGNQAFQTELNNNFNRLKTSQLWPFARPAPGNKNIKLLYRLQLPNGNIDPNRAIQLADVAEPKNALLRINLEHGIEIYGSDPVPLPQSLAGLATNPIIIACPGSTTCPKGLANCWATADAIRNALANRPCHKARINISGCPNNCAHSAVADIGLVAVMRKQNGKPTRYYRLFKGGGNGRTDKLAEQSETVLARDAPAVVENLMTTQR